MLEQATIAHPGNKLLLAASDGKGFVAKMEDVIAETRKGRQVVNLRTGATLSAVRRIATDHDYVAVVGENRKLVVFPLDAGPFLVPLALPGDDVRPENFVCFRFDGTRGLYIHPDIWHEGVFTCAGTQRFFDRQGAVHARVSVDFAREFGCLIEAAVA